MSNTFSKRFTSHMTNSFFKDIHIQNDENAFLVYLLNIYI